MGGMDVIREIRIVYQFVFHWRPVGGMPMPECCGQSLHWIVLLKVTINLSLIVASNIYYQSIIIGSLFHYLHNVLHLLQSNSKCISGYTK